MNVHFKSSSSPMTSGWSLTTTLRTKELKLYALNRIPYYRNEIILEMAKKSKMFCIIVLRNLVGGLMTPHHQIGKYRKSVSISQKIPNKDVKMNLQYRETHISWILSVTSCFEENHEHKKRWTFNR